MARWNFNQAPEEPVDSFIDRTSRRDSREYYHDRATEQGRQPHVRCFSLPINEIIAKCEAWDYQTPKIVSIIQFFRDKDYLSEKQKWALSYYAAYGPKENEIPKDLRNNNKPPPLAIKSIDDDDLPF